ncbi:hypothetical protein V2J09_018503 [Rumex salicifolius]
MENIKSLTGIANGGLDGVATLRGVGKFMAIHQGKDLEWLLMHLLRVHAVSLTQHQYNQLVNLINKQSGGQDMTHAAFLAGNSSFFSLSTSTNWILDSGASDHMTPHLHLFQSYASVSKPTFFTLPDGKRILIHHIDQIQLSPHITLHNVLHVPDLHFNLLSVHRLTKDLSSNVVFTTNMCLLHAPLMSKPLVIGHEANGLYVVDKSSSISKDVHDTSISTQFHTKIKAIRSANALEFCDSSAYAFYSNEGIIHQTTCVDTPTTKWKSGKKVQIPLFFQTNLPLTFWGDCLLTATYLLLAIIHPNERLFHKPLDYSTLRAFGCLCFVNTLKRNRDKFQPLAKPYVFIGGALVLSPSPSSFRLPPACVQLLYFLLPASLAGLVPSPPSWCLYPFLFLVCSVFCIFGALVGVRFLSLPVLFRALFGALVLVAVQSEFPPIGWSTKLFSLSVLWFLLGLFSPWDFCVFGAYFGLAGEWYLCITSRSGQVWGSPSFRLRFTVSSALGSVWFDCLVGVSEFVAALWFAGVARYRWVSLTAVVCQCSSATPTLVCRLSRPVLARRDFSLLAACCCFAERSKVDLCSSSPCFVLSPLVADVESLWFLDFASGGFGGFTLCAPAGFWLEAGLLLSLAGS